MADYAVRFRRNRPGRVADRSDEAAVGCLAEVYRCYDTSARCRRAWNPTNRGNVMMRAELERAVHESGALRRAESARVLDLGCGHGYWLRRLAALGVAPERLTGVDVLPERVEAAASAAAGATIVEANAANLPFPAESFDITILFTVLSSVVDELWVKRVVEEARRVTAAGGFVLIYEPRVPNPFNPATRRINRREIDASLGRPRIRRTLTVLPGLARRLGPATTALYPLLARVPVLRTHQLLIYRPSG